VVPNSDAEYFDNFRRKIAAAEEESIFTAALTYTPDISASSSNLPLDASPNYPECLGPIPEIIVSPEFLLPIEASPVPPNEVQVKPVMVLDWTEFYETSEKFYVLWDSLNNPAYIWPEGSQKHDKKCTKSVFYVYQKPSLKEFCRLIIV